MLLVKCCVCECACTSIIYKHCVCINVHVLVCISDVWSHSHVSAEEVVYHCNNVPNITCHMLGYACLFMNLLLVSVCFV